MRTTAFVLGLLLSLSLGTAPSRAQQTDTTYTVQEGDTLYGIAQNAGVSVRTLMRWNDMDSPSIQTGQTLRIRPPRDASPASADTTARPPADTGRAAAAPPPPDTVDAPRPYGQHTVKAGDTFVNLALRLGTTADSLFALNDSTAAPLSPGRTLRLPRRFGPPVHTVDRGQTLYSIAGEYGVSVRSLKVKNDLSSDTLRPGQQLQIPRGGGTGMPSPGRWASPDTTGPVARYPDAFAGRLTASGTAYNPNDLVVSHPSLPFDSVVLLSTTNPERHTFARVIDRGPVEEGMLLDVSTAVARQLSLPTEGTAPSVSLRVVWTAN